MEVGPRLGVRRPGSNIYSPKPEKNEWSHGAEADQYILLGAGECHEVTGREERRRRSGDIDETSYDGDFAVLGVVQVGSQNTLTVPVT